MMAGTNGIDVNTALEPIHFLVFSASLRIDSFNTRLAHLAAQVIAQRGGKVDLASMADFNCPSFNQDVEARSFPTGAQEFRRRIEASDAFVIASPEYNASIPGVLKNAIDWVSRFQPQPFHARHALLLSASPALTGGTHGVWALRMPLEYLGVRVFPDMFSLAQAHQAFDAQGRLANLSLSERFDENILAFMDLVEAAKRYPSMKRAWIASFEEHASAAIAHAEERIRQPSPMNA